MSEENKELESEENATARENTEVEEITEAEEIKTVEETAPVQETPAVAEHKPNKKKIVLIIIAAIVAVALVAGGIVAAKQIITKKQSLTFEDGTPTPDSQEGMKQGHGEEAEVITGEDALNKATVKEADAINLIQGLSDEQLGIKKADYSIMVAQQAYVIEGEKYVQVIAAEKQENEDGTFNITPKAKFYISFDGETILKENMTAPGSYEEIKK